MIVSDKLTAEETMENQEPPTQVKTEDPKEEAKEEKKPSSTKVETDDVASESSAGSSAGEEPSAGAEATGTADPALAAISLGATSLPSGWVQQAKAARRAERSSTATAGSMKDQRMIFTPEPMDILLGRGRRLQEHRGNVRFRRVINRCRHQYLTSDRCEKRGLAEHIVRLMKEKSRFLKRITRIDGKEMWMEVSDQVATEKVSHALREKKIPDQHRQGGSSSASTGGAQDDAHPNDDDDVEEDIAALQAGHRASSSKKDRPKKKDDVDDAGPLVAPSLSMPPEDMTPEMAEHARAQQLLMGRQNPLDTLASLATAGDAPPYPMVGVPSAAVLPSSALHGAAWPHASLGMPLGLGGAAAAEIAAQRQLLAAELAAAQRARLLAGIDYPLPLGAGAASGLLLAERRQLPLHMMSNEQLVGIVAQQRLLEGGRRPGQIPPGLY